VCGVSTSDGSTLVSNEVLRAVQYPDPSTGAASSSLTDTFTANRLGDTLTKTDRNGNVHTLSYDVVGRATTDAVTTLGSGVDGAIRRIETAYDGQGNPYLLTQYSAASGGSVVNQVKRDYNGLGQLITEWQAVAGAVTGSTKKVQYTYTEMSGGANHSRLTSMVYPTGFTVNYSYASGIDANISRLSSLTNSSTTLESYTYLGLATVVKRAHPEPGVDLTYVKLSGESNGDAGDQYTGLDRFGRVVDQRWIVTSSGAALDRFQYGYDRNSNRMYRENLVNSSFSELYHANGSSAGYDALDQMTEFRRGTLNAAKDTITTSSRTQSWDFDATGNWESVTTNGTTETRGHNRQNEITSRSGASSLAYDANGNNLQDGAGNVYTYDAWNRLVQIVDRGTDTTLATYTPDALNRRIVAATSTTNRYLYYSAAWQVVEEYSGNPDSEQTAYDTRYVWSPVYVDALVLRESAEGRRRYVLQDANFNVTSIISSGGVVQERYVYDAYGQRTVLSASWGTLSGSSYAWVYGWQGFRQEFSLAWARMRDVSTVLGRPLQMDPLGFGAGDVNWYRWEGNSTASVLDPMGLQASESRPTRNIPLGAPTGSSLDRGRSQQFIKNNYPGLKNNKFEILILSNVIDSNCHGTTLAYVADRLTANKLPYFYPENRGAAFSINDLIMELPNGTTYWKTSDMQGSWNLIPENGSTNVAVYGFTKPDGTYNITHTAIQLTDGRWMHQMGDKGAIIITDNPTDVTAGHKPGASKPDAGKEKTYGPILFIISVPGVTVSPPPKNKQK
jgi:hypothetical protein